MDGDGPIATRDFPEGCVRLPRKVTKNPTRPQSAGTLEGEATSNPNGAGAYEVDGELPRDFDQVSVRDQFLQRRALYSRLLQHYQKLKTRGQLLGNRPDLQAMKQMNEEGKSNDFQKFGHVPGIVVGDSFEYRTEMFVVGLHRQVQGGIAWVEDRGEKVACSVVISGGYRDDDDYGETVKYTGQGGNDYRGDKRQLEDQKPKKGNKALINTYKRGEVVRLIRGHDVDAGWNKIYSYDGLYKVKNYNLEVGRDGHKVYTFDLERLKGQPPLDTEKWKRLKSLKK